MLTKEQLVLTKSPYDFLFNFLGYTLLNLTNLLINLLGLSQLNLGLFLCERYAKCIQNFFIQNVFHISTNFCIHFIYKIQLTQFFSFCTKCIQKLVEMWYTFYIHFVHILYTSVVYILYNFCIQNTYTVSMWELNLT